MPIEQKELIRYVRYGDKLVGCVIATGKTKVGWSQCNIEKDSFDKEMGKMIARNRANNGWKRKPRKYKFFIINDELVTEGRIASGCNTKVDLIQETINEMRKRALGYYK